MVEGAPAAPDQFDPSHLSDSSHLLLRLSSPLADPADPLGGLAARLLPRCTFPPAGTPLACAVSGGADSLALLLLARAAGCVVTAFHVDHGLRPGSAAEADVVAAVAARVGARVECRRVLVTPGPNLEARAREARFAVLPSGVATGHTMDDQAETILVNLLRGAGADGLAGMAPGPPHPLLALRRHETHALCAAAGLVPVCDASNDDPAYVRNRVRHELLPLCAEVAGRDPVPLLARQAGVLRDEVALLDSLASDAAARSCRRSGGGTDAPALGSSGVAPLAARGDRCGTSTHAGRGGPGAGRGLRRRSRDRAQRGMAGAPDPGAPPGGAGPLR